MKWILIITLAFCTYLRGYSAQSVHSVYFDIDLFDIRPDQKISLDSFIDLLSGQNIESIYILAYCDDSGKEHENDVLSQNRANQCRQYLIDHGIQVNLIKLCEGRGEIAYESDIDIPLIQQRTHNRRCEITANYTISSPPPKFSIINSHSKVGERIILPQLLFPGGYHELLPESYPTLDTLVSNLKQNPNIKISIEGHICCTDYQEALDFGTQKVELSFQRAKFIRDYLVRNEIDSMRLSYKGMGSRYKLGKGDQFDRRVEIIITSDK